MEFGGRVAVVTGAGRGIGRSIAHAFAYQGAVGVVVGYQANVTAADDTAGQLREVGCDAATFGGDVADPATARGMARLAIERWGRLDAWVNNAGVTADGPFLRMPEARWRRVLDTNLEGTRHGCTAALEVMFRQRSGAIVNVASVVGLVGNAGQANYAAAKAAIFGLTRALAVDFGRRGVRINAVAPGYVATDLTEDLDKTAKDALLSRVPLGRFGCAEDVANTVVFLAGGRAAYITGATFVVDGGLTAGLRLGP
ncbi:MAG: 3-oxoacyl-ACP reductase FabG [Chloroflexi bacterium]|nr:3-oxoacyl-ACP reductase FabG [Chloroflexota bacterium]